MIAQSKDKINTFWLCYGSYTGKKDIRLFLQYVQANLHEKRQDKAYKVYMTEAVKNINRILAENMTGSYMKVSYMEMLNPKPEETRTAEQIIEDIRTGLQRLS